MKRDKELIRGLLLKLESLPLPPGAMVLLNGREPELAVDGYSADQIEYHLSLLKEDGLIDSPGSGPAIGVSFRSLSPRGHDFLDNIRDPAVLAAAGAIAEAAEPTLDLSKVFVVHGHDGAPKAEVARFIEKLGFEAVILHERPNKGRALITKFREEAAGVGFAVVLMTPDDLGKGKEAPDLKPRARQNVVFELGFFIGKLGPERVAALVKGDIEIPSDFDGVVYIQLDKADWKTKLGIELQETGYKFDWNTVMRS
jgi:predicted nucleotide-binding protein